MNSHAYTYDLASQRLTQTRTDNSFVNYAYDQTGQVTQALGHEAGGTPARLNETLGYGYDKAHNLSFRTNNALVETFTVNTLNELSTETHSGTLTVVGTSGATATNVTITGGANDGAATRYGDNTFARTNFIIANGINSFTAIAADALGRHSTNTVTAYLPDSVPYAYDLNGNLLSDGTRNFVYDGENQLILVYVTNSWQSQFVYDGEMRRRIRRESTWLGGVWQQTNEVRYIYDGNVVIEERDQHNLPFTSYTRGRDLSGSLQGAGGIGGLLAISQQPTVNPQHFYYHADGNGNVTALVNAQQITVARYLYNPFGNTMAVSGPMAGQNLYRFSSKEWHGNSGLVCYLYRHYDPQLQRWLNRDPLGEDGGVYLNEFVGNDPINNLDIAGLDVWIEGPSQSEPTGHQSINVGDPNGDYSSYSFGADGGFNLSYGLEGSVYGDDSKGGTIGVYKKTTPLEDQRLKNKLDHMIDNKGAYGLGSTCRSWSQDQFKDAPGKDSQPPKRTPQPRTFFRAATSTTSKPTSTTTSSSGTSTSR